MSKFLQQQPLILASGSSIRRKLLHSLGVEFLVIPSHCDEEALKAAFQGKNPLELGYALAASKALKISKQYPQHIVIAADQLCVIGDKLLDKPLTHPVAVTHLNLLNGKQHQQIACLCIAQNNHILWQHHEIARLTMHHLSNAAIEAYLLEEQPYSSCGAYQFETKGKWLFSEIEGQEDTILGLPLMPLTNALKQLDIVTNA